MADCAIFALELRFVALEIEGARFYTASLRDLSERRRAQEAIQRREVAEAEQLQVEVDYDGQIALQKVRDIIWNMEGSDQETLISALPGILDDLHIRYNACGITSVDTQTEIKGAEFRDKVNFLPTSTSFEPSQGRYSTEDERAAHTP